MDIRHSGLGTRWWDSVHSLDNSCTSARFPRAHWHCSRPDTFRSCSGKHISAARRRRKQQDTNSRDLQGQAIGITAGNSIIQNGLKRNLQASSFDQLRTNADAVAQNLASPDTLLSTYATSDGELSALLTAFSSALDDLWWFLLAMALFAGLLSLMIVDVELGPKHNAKDSTLTSAASDASEECGSLEQTVVQGDLKSSSERTI